MRIVSRLTVLFAAGVLATAGCGSDDPAGPTRGGIRVSVATEGVDIDSDGFVVTVDGATSRSVWPEAPITVADLQPGDHLVRLDGVAENCHVDGANPVTVTVVEGHDVTSSFAVECDAVVAGQWSYDSTLAIEGIACDITGKLVLSQDASSFSGSIQNGRFFCSAIGFDEPLPTGFIRHGATTRDAVTFDIDTEDYRHTGTYHGNTMGGTVLLKLDDGTGVRGSWTATRTASLVLDRSVGIDEVSTEGRATLGELVQQIRRTAP